MRSISRPKYSPPRPTTLTVSSHPAANNLRGDQLLSPLPPISTVNDAEIAHFSRLSALWWDERGEFGLLHKMNPHRIRFIREKIYRDEQYDFDAGAAVVTRPVESCRVLEGMNVLNVGCGGVILSENTSIATRRAAADPGLAAESFRHAVAETLVREAKRFDVVCSMEVVEHVDNPGAFLRSCAELVELRRFSALSSLAHTHTFSKFINPEELVSFFAKPLTEGSQPWISRVFAHRLPTRMEAEVRGIVYVPWQGDWVLAPRSTTPWATQVNYLFWARRSIGDA